MVNLTTTTKSVSDPFEQKMIEEIQAAAKPGTFYFHLFRLQDALCNVRSRVVWCGIHHTTRLRTMPCASSKRNK